MIKALNFKQKEAIEAVKGAVLVIAGAGTGKTTVLVEHVRHLIQDHNIDPSNIVATTFTIKATEEMKQRLAQNCKVPEWIGTFHSICIKIVRAHADKLSINSNFGIVEGFEQQNICRRLFGTQAEVVLEKINYWKNNCKKPQDVPYHEYKIHYQRYQQALLEENKFDFGDLIMECCYLWAQFPDVLAQYQKQFTHICIDEFQDTNAVQWLWLELLASNNPNIHIFCVGDDDQAIYGFRGSDNKYILNFSNRYKNASVIKLEQNYRSTPEILESALKIVGYNKQRLGKILISNKPNSKAVQVMHFPNSYRESVWLIEQIIKKQGSIAILVRTTWQVQEVSALLKSKGLLESENFKGLLTYLRFLNSESPELFMQMIQNPKRGFGQAFGEKFMKTYQKDELFPTTILENAQNIANSKQKEALEILEMQLSKWQQLKNNSFALINTIWKELFDEKGSLTFALFLAQKYPILSDFLQHYHMPEISILTIHAAKGLEFDSVYLLGWEENVFPHVRAILTDDIESERRLAYVAITRGKEEVFITHCTTRESPKGILRKGPSRFLSLL